MTVRIGITCNRVGYENRLSLAYVRAVLRPVLHRCCCLFADKGAVLADVKGN